MAQPDSDKRPLEQRYAAIRDEAFRRTVQLNERFQGIGDQSRISQIRTKWRSFLNQIVELNQAGRLPTDAQVNEFAAQRVEAEPPQGSSAVPIPVFDFEEDEYFLIVRELHGRFIGTDIFQHELEHHIAFSQEGIPARLVILVGMQSDGRTYYSFGTAPKFPKDMPEEEVRRIMLFAANATTQKGALDRASIENLQ